MRLLFTFVKKLPGLKVGNEVLDEADAASLKQRLEGNKELRIVDVCGADEFNGELGHINGALNIPLPDLPGRITELRARDAHPMMEPTKTKLVPLNSRKR